MKPDNVAEFWLFGTQFLLMIVLQLTSLGSVVISVLNIIYTYNNKGEVESKYTQKVAKYIIKHNLNKVYNKTASYYISELLISDRIKYKNLNFVSESSLIANESIIETRFATLKYVKVNKMLNTSMIEDIFSNDEFKHILDATIKLLNDTDTLHAMNSSYTEEVKQLDTAYSDKLAKIYNERIFKI